MVEYINAVFEYNNNIWEMRFKNRRKLLIYCDMENIQPSIVTKIKTIKGNKTIKRRQNIC